MYKCLVLLFMAGSLSACLSSTNTFDPYDPEQAACANEINDIEKDRKKLVEFYDAGKQERYQDKFIDLEINCKSLFLYCRAESRRTRSYKEAARLCRHTLFEGGYRSELRTLEWWHRKYTVFYVKNDYENASNALAKMEDKCKKILSGPESGRIYLLEKSFPIDVGYYRDTFGKEESFKKVEEFCRAFDQKLKYK